MSFGIKPLGNRVVIKRVEAEEKTASGIVLPGRLRKNHRWRRCRGRPWNQDDKWKLR